MTPSKPSEKPFALRLHPHLYEINTWAWLEKLSARAGRLIKLGDIPDAEWDALARLGFNAIWLMGVWRRSPEVAPNRARRSLKHSAIRSRAAGLEARGRSWLAVRGRGICSRSAHRQLGRT